MNECDCKIRNANRILKSDDRTESNLRRGREGRWEEDKEEERGGGGGKGGERVTRAYTVKV